jgi:hypothetical protein
MSSAVRTAASTTTVRPEELYQLLEQPLNQLAEQPLFLVQTSCTAD